MKAKYRQTFWVTKWIDAELLSKLTHNYKMNKGEYAIVRNSLKGNEEIVTAFIACPECGEGHPLGNHQIDFYDKEKTQIKDIHPSLFNERCCGYHGWLKNGEFTNI